MRSASRLPIFYARNDGNPVTPPNLPSGWAGFRLLRKVPAPAYEAPNHGNHRHGGYSAQGIAQRRETRAFFRWIKGRGPRPPMTPLPGEGWRLWREGRGSGRIVRHLPRTRARGEVPGLLSAARTRAALLRAEAHSEQRV